VDTGDGERNRDDGRALISIWLRAAEEKLVIARIYGASALPVNLGQGARIEVEGEVPNFAWTEVEALK